MLGFNLYANRKLLRVAVSSVVIAPLILGGCKSFVKPSQTKIDAQKNISTSTEGAKVSIETGITKTEPPKTLTVTPLPTEQPTEEQTEAPQENKKEMEVPLEKWEGVAPVIISDSYPMQDYSVKNPEKTNEAHTEAVLRTLASWEMIRVFSSKTLMTRDPENGIHFFRETDSWIKDRELRPYDVFDSIPKDELEAFKKEVSGQDFFKFWGKGREPYFSDKAREAIEAYAQFLASFLKTTNGVLEDVVLPRVRDDVHTSRHTDASIHMTLTEPENIDFKNGIGEIFTQNGSDAEWYVKQGAWMDFGWGIEDGRFYVIIINESAQDSTYYEKGDPPAMNLYLALRALGRGGNPYSIGISQEDVLPLNLMDSFVQLRESYTRSMVPGTSFIGVIER